VGSAQASAAECGLEGTASPPPAPGRGPLPPEWNRSLLPDRACTRRSTWVSRMRENLTYGSNGGRLETERNLHGDGLSPCVGNARTRQPGLRRSSPPRQSSTLPHDSMDLPPVNQPADHAARQQAFRLRLQETALTVAYTRAPHALPRASVDFRAVTCVVVKRLSVRPVPERVLNHARARGGVEG